MEFDLELSEVTTPRSKPSQSTCTFLTADSGAKMMTKHNAETEMKEQLMLLEAEEAQKEQMELFTRSKGQQAYYVRCQPNAGSGESPGLNLGGGLVDESLTIEEMKCEEVEGIGKGKRDT